MSTGMILKDKMVTLLFNGMQLSGYQPALGVSGSSPTAMCRVELSLVIARVMSKLELKIWPPPLPILL